MEGVPHMPFEASVFRLAVDKDYRKIGLGKTLMETVEHYAKKNNCKNVTLITGNLQSKKFYKRIGYTNESLERA
jgi:ribosomal protein S18 acetylase RimI-like enzyme